MSRWPAECALALVLIVAVGAPGQAWGASPAGASPATQPAAADAAEVRQLVGRNLRARQAALDRIVESGAAVEPALRKLLDGKLDADARRNVEVALERIHDGRILGPSLITLHVRGASPRRVIDGISRQCGATVPVFPANLLDDPALAKLTLDFDRRPFWDVMRDVSQQLRMEYLTSDGDVRLGRGSGRHHPLIAPAGAFLVSADALGFRSRLTMELAVYSEPKIVVSRFGDLKLDRAEDDQGKPLLPLTTRGRGGRPWFGRGGFGRFADSGIHRVVLPYKLPADEVTKIARFKGSITVSAQAGTRPWRIADPLTLTSQTQMVGTLPVTLEKFSAKTSGKGYELLAVIAEDGINAADRDQILDSIRAHLRVTDADGHALTIGDVDTQRTTDGTEITVEFLMPDPRTREIGPPAKLAWDIPAELRKVVIPFDFKDIPISDPFD